MKILCQLFCTLLTCLIATSAIAQEASWSELNNLYMQNKSNINYEELVDIYNDFYHVMPANYKENEFKAQKGRVNILKAMKKQFSQTPHKVFTEQALAEIQKYDFTKQAFEVYVPVRGITVESTQAPQKYYLNEDLNTFPFTFWLTPGREDLYNKSYMKMSPERAEKLVEKFQKTFSNGERLATAIITYRIVAQCEDKMKTKYIPWTGQFLFNVEKVEIIDGNTKEHFGTLTSTVTDYDSKKFCPGMNTLQ